MRRDDYKITDEDTIRWAGAQRGVCGPPEGLERLLRGPEPHEEEEALYE